MTTENSNSLVNLYGNRIGEPRTADEAHGYWVFVVGLLASVLGMLLVLPTETGDTLRGIGIGIAAIGLLMLLVGPIIRLPLQRVATTLSYVGVLIGLVGVIWFAVEFNQGNWSASFENNEPLVIAVYGFGVLVIALGGIFTPLLRGRREEQEAAEERAAVAESQRDQAIAEAEERAREAEQRAEEAQRQSEIAAEEHAQRLLLEDELDRIADSQSQFEFFTDKAGEHRWRLRHRNRNIIADCAEGYSSRQKAQQGLSAVKRDAFGAAVIDLDQLEEAEVETVDDAVEGEEAPEFVADADSRATFETYEDAAGKHRWRLRHDNGEIIADSGQGYSVGRSRDDAVEYVRQYTQTADYLRVDPTAFELYRDAEGSYRWRLLHQNGNIIADSGQSYTSRQSAREGIESVQENVGANGHASFEVYEDEAGEYRWRLEHDNGNILADPGQGYESKAEAENAVERVRNYAPDGNVLAVGSAAFEIYEDEGNDWRWRLRHRNGNILADSGQGYAARGNVEEGILSVKRNAPNAEVESV